ncbi:hypothetical protein [Microbulbifer hydrolyticus]|uniref:Lipoprotein n=1 Tax=Microbulbifer hydrolyticus TaxID=48074 RepID=A0ABX6IUG9_9GAMM|nr:hypothetical protein [Microbulbifer hydrolyticus]QHQ38484.1 hypothetical protein GTQ55_05410 [Microbulbifer hydrolyticus]QHQ40467.1 hypothetical protein GTQ55_16780 [Microbulbifer hydrolyticus]
MRALFLIFFAFIVVSCSREVYPAIAGFHFSAGNIRKAELLPALDEYAKEHGFKKLQEGGGNMKPEVKENFLFAIYINSQSYEFSVNNVLDRSCFTVATYDKARTGDAPAIELAESLKSWLSKNYQGSFVEHGDQYCGQTH